MKMSECTRWTVAAAVAVAISFPAWIPGASAATINVPADYATIQAAINAAADGDTISIAAGTYVESASYSGTAKQFDVVGAVDVDGKPITTIQGMLSIDHPGSDTGWCIENINFLADSVNGALLKLKNVNNAVVRNCTFDGDGRFLGTPAVNGLSFESCPNGNTHPSVENCVFRNGLYTAITGIASDLTVSDCVIENVKGGLNMRGSNLVLQDTAISVIAPGGGDTYGIRYGTTDAGSANGLTLTRCTISVDKNGQTPDPGNYHCAVYIRSGAIGTLEVSECSIDGDMVNLSPTTLDVSANYWGSASGPNEANFYGTGPITYSSFYSDPGLTQLHNVLRVPADYATIQAAINAAAAGDVVLVAAGTYHEQLTISKALSLVGEDGAVLDGTGLAPTWTTGIKIRCGEVTIDNIDVCNFTQDGITAYDNIDMPNLHIVNCKISNIQPGYWGFGIYIGYESEGFEYVPPDLTAHLDFSGLLIESNEVENTACSGIVLQSITGAAGTLVVRDNYVHDVTSNDAIWIDCARNLTVEGNVLENNLWGIDFTAIPEGWFVEDGPYGPKDIVIQGNTITGSTEEGIALYNGWPATITIGGNIIQGNGTGVENRLAGSLDVSSNYWGAADGPGGEGSGSGDAISAGVTYSSYYADAALTQLMFMDVYVDDDFDASTPGWGVTHFATVQEGVDAAGAGGTVRVAAGTYVEQVEITKAVEIVGAGAGQTIIKGFASMPLSFTTGSNANKPVVYVHDTDGAVIRDLTLDGDGQGNTNYRYDGFGFRNAGGMVSNCAVIAVRDTPFSGAQHGVAIYGYNDDGTTRTVEVLDCAITDFQKNAVALMGANMIAVVRGCAIAGAGSTTTTAQNGIQISLGAVGTVENNDVSGVYYGGSGWTASGILVSSAGAGTVVDGNTVDAQTAIYAYDSPSLSITDNVLDNRGGLTDWAVILYLSDDAVFTGNTVSDANGSGLDVYESDNALVEGNTFTGNPYGIGVAGGSSGAVIRNNTIQGNTDGVIVESGSSATTTPNYWGDETGPSGEGSGLGDTLWGATGFSPWWEDAAMTTLRYGDTQFMTDRLIGDGETFHIYGDATIGDGATPVVWTVNNGTLEIDGRLDLTDGTTLAVRDGTLILHTADGETTISGSFIIFDSWGTVYFEDDTVVDGDMLALVSHLVFSDGVTLTVNGSLTLDGCVMEGLNDGDTYTVVANDGATFRMYRTEMYDCDLQVNADGAELESNLFNNDVTVGSDADGAMVYHNVFVSGSLTDNGSGTITTVDGWGNVTSADATASDLSLNLAGADAEGNLYIQTGAVVTVTMDVTRLGQSVTGLDALLGYNSRHFLSPGDITMGGGDWTVLIYTNWMLEGIGAVTYGKIDSSLGVRFDAPPEGTSADALIATVTLQATASEGITKVFFRPPQAILPERTLFFGAPGGNPESYVPFTVNSGYITVDSTPPLARDFTATQDQWGSPTNVFADAAVVGVGTVTFTVDAYDALAGLAPADNPVLGVTNQVTGSTLAATLAGSTGVDIGGTNYTRYTFTVPVAEGDDGGVYDTVVTVIDRSGNQTVLADTITVDVTDPSAMSFTGTQLQESGIVDLFGGATAQQGALVFTVDAYDGLAGLNPPYPTLVLTNPVAGASLAAAYVGEAIVEIGGTNFTRYTFGALVDASTPNGTYEATMTVQDRVGNETVLTDSFTVQKNAIEVTVELQGAAAGPFDRDVVFKATDGSGAVLKTWTRTLTFAGGVGTTTLVEAPDGMANLSAKTAWTLRTRVAAVLDGDGQATVSFTGVDCLYGGDLTDDNRVTQLDYARLRYFWYTAEPSTDINGDGATSTTDYNILRANWFTMGDAE